MDSAYGENLFILPVLRVAGMEIGPALMRGPIFLVGERCLVLGEGV